MEVFLAAFLTGLVGITTGAAMVSYIAFRLYQKEALMAKEFSEKVLNSLNPQAAKTKKPPVDFLSLIKNPEDPKVN